MEATAYILTEGEKSILRPLPQRGPGNLPRGYHSPLGGDTLLQQAVKRIPEGCRTVVLTERCCKDAARSQIQETGIPSVELLEEPVGCSTAAAVLSAAAWEEKPGRVIALLPAGQIMDQSVFQKIFSRAAEEAAHASGIITVGMPAGKLHAEDESLHLIRKQPGGGGTLLYACEFARKTGENNEQDGEYLLHTGMLFGRAEVFLHQGMEHCPDIALPIVSAVKQGEGTLESAYRQIMEGSACRSIEDAVLKEMEEELYVLPAPRELAWNDLGSWEAVISSLDSDSRGNSWLGEQKPVLADAQNTAVCNYTGIPVQIEGFDGLLAVVTENGILIRKRKDLPH